MGKAMGMVLEPFKQSLEGWKIVGKKNIKKNWFWILVGIYGASVFGGLSTFSIQSKLLGGISWALLNVFFAGLMFRNWIFAKKPTSRNSGVLTL